MTLSEAIFRHVTGCVGDALVYAVSAPMAEVEGQSVVIIAFDGATITSLSEPSTRESLYTISAVSSDHLAAITLAEAICEAFHGFGGVMGGVGGVDVVDVDASEAPEDYDPENALFARNVSLRVTYEF